MLQLRPSSADTAEASTSTRQLRRAYVSPDVLRAHKLIAGDWARLSSLAGHVVPGTGGAEAVVQLWPRSGLDDDMIVLRQQHLQNVPSDAVQVIPFKASESTGIAKEMTIIPASAHPSLPPSPNPEGQRETEWTIAAVKEALISGKYLRKGMKIMIGDEDATVAPSYYQISSVVVSDKKKGPADQLVDGMGKMSVNGISAVEWYEMDWRTSVTIGDGKASVAATQSGGTGTSKASTARSGTSLPSYINLFTPSTTSTYSTLGGLDAQIAQIRSLLELPMSRPELFTLFGLTPPRGILLHGPPGTGKTALARAVASSSSCACIVVNGPELASAFHGESEERLRGVFDEAKKRAPCIVVLDEVDALCPRRDGDGGEVEKRVVATLLTLMDGMSGGEGVFVIAATNRPNSIDPALRRPGRFDREIEIGIPDAHGRQSILEILLSKMPHSLTSAEISSLASRTHGFVGADLSSLVREGAVACIERWVVSPSTPQPRMGVHDIETVLPTIRPSTMREVFVETTEVRWADIGGQDAVKQKLRECVEWPLTHKDTFKRLGVQAPRGVLLYGPPGCSKTMTAKALATESGINFLAVKGPELLNKYVGESERAVREIFRKARAAAPSIIFFDEIDALGSARSEEASHSGVLTSLLNEMDGIEDLTGVTVVAATNRPDVLDDALMRPGRLDRILFVGAPDMQTRRDIFGICLRRMAVEDGVDVDELARITEGCSGAEVASICQDAALSAMNEDIDAPFVKKQHLLDSARSVRRRITPEMIQFFDAWRDQSGLRSA